MVWAARWLVAWRPEWTRLDWTGRLIGRWGLDYSFLCLSGGEISSVGCSFYVVLENHFKIYPPHSGREKGRSIGLTEVINFNSNPLLMQAAGAHSRGMGRLGLWHAVRGSVNTPASKFQKAGTFQDPWTAGGVIHGEIEDGTHLRRPWEDRVF